MSQTTLPEIERPPRPDKRPVLSACTVLILSGFVLGIAIGSELPEDFRVMICIAGLAGLVSYIGLDHIAYRRRANVERREQEYFQHRLIRHIDAGVSDALDHEELLELAREATSVRELRELVPAQSGTTVS